MKEKRIIRHSPEHTRSGKTDWSRVASLSEDQVIAAAKSDPDAQPTDADFWKNARVVMPERKIPITLRVDRDIVVWFKGQGRRYQTRMNAVLKAYMRAHRKAG
jgi:uncharacterized protein (DUF4415 family)